RAAVAAAATAERDGREERDEGEESAHHAGSFQVCRRDDREPPASNVATSNHGLAPCQRSAENSAIVSPSGFLPSSRSGTVTPERYRPPSPSWRKSESSTNDRSCPRSNTPAQNSTCPSPPPRRLSRMARVM